MRFRIDPRFRQLEDLSELLIHFPRQIARNLDVLFLVLADRHDVAVINQNVGRHQHWIAEESYHRSESAREFVFIGVRAFEQPLRRNGRQNPGQLRDLRYIALFEERSAFGIETGRKKIDRNTPDVFAENVRVAHTGQRVIIGNEIKRFALILKRDSGPHHAEIIADVQEAARLNAG